MRRNILVYIVIYIFIYYLFTNNIIIKDSVINSSILFINNILPSLFPMYILSSLLLYYNFPYFLYKLTNNSLLSLFSLFLLSGSPTNSLLLKNMYLDNNINLEDSNKILNIIYFSNPLFLYNILSRYLPITLAIFIILSSYLYNLGYFFILSRDSKIIINNNYNKHNFIYYINYILKNSGSLFLNIYSYLLFFNILINMLPSKFMIFGGLFEISYGLNYLVNIKYNIFIKGILSIIYINFGGLSIMMQIKSILLDTLFNFNNYIYSRIYAVIINIILFIVCYFCYFYFII